MKIAACSKTYGKRTVLRCRELTLEPGQICAVVGPNGSGKSTYAKLIAGVLEPDSAGRLVESAAEIRYMPQKSYPFRMSVEKNILLSGDDRKRAEKLMEKLRLTAVSHQRAGSLSGGETAKMSLARVLMQRCDLLILDEPTAAMDMESTLAAEELIRAAAREQGCSVLLITHSVQQARRLADRVLFLHQGKLRESGDAERVLYRPNEQETRRFLEFYGV